MIKFDFVAVGAYIPIDLIDEKIENIYLILIVLIHAIKSIVSIEIFITFVTGIELACDILANHLNVPVILINKFNC